MKSHFLKSVFALSAAVICISGVPMSSQAVTLGSGSQSYRIGVLNAIGTADSSYDSDEPCTRAQFARLLVLSSTYKDTIQTELTSAAANDVPATYDGVQYVKTALARGWMRTRLGGNFAPEEPVTLNDAAKATITILGYTDEDFTTNVSQERLALFKSLNLNDGIGASNGADQLTKRDCINIIYNLLRTNTKGSGSIYGAALDLSLSADNELNATSVIETALTGPILCKTVDEFHNCAPFDISDATYYFNGKNSGMFGKMYIESQITHQGWVIIYYNANTRTIWAYGSDNGNNGYIGIRGKVTSIVYEDDNIAAPSAVYLDSEKYTLNNADVKFMFSMSGPIKVGDYCVLVCKDTADPEAENFVSELYAIAVIKWDANADGSHTGTIFAQNAGKYVAGEGAQSNSGNSSDLGPGSGKESFVTYSSSGSTSSD